MLAGLALPGLSALLGQADRTTGLSRSLDSWLAAEFGVPDTPPFAALRRAGEPAMPQVPDTQQIWVCADAVSLRFARQHLLLDASAAQTLQPNEAAALFRDINTSFGDIGSFSVTDTGRGYLALNAAHADKLDVALTPVFDADNRPVAQFQPQGEQAAWWSRLANELQVFCHNHEVNRAREARGEPMLNALWLWGVGRMPEKLSSPGTRVAGEYPLLTGLCHLAGATLEKIDPLSPAEWMLVDTLHGPAQQRDATRWREALQALDADVLLPLWQGLRAGLVSQITIVTPGDAPFTRFISVATPRWQFWRRAATTAQLVSALDGHSTNP